MANTSKRGFASMDAIKQREIASKGGKAAHAKGTAHEFTTDEARVAGRKGGEAVSRDRAHMSTIGREGGHSRGARARATGNTTSDATRSASSESFERRYNSERGEFENSRPSSIGGSKQHSGEQRASFSASDRGENSRGGNERDERSGDSPSNGPFSGRDEI
ncbi:MAG TPA: KGG domain-containing protein [Thermoanaerobaculia bacterium]